MPIWVNINLFTNEAGIYLHRTALTLAEFPSVIKRYKEKKQQKQQQQQQQQHNSECRTKQAIFKHVDNLSIYLGIVFGLNEFKYLNINYQ